MPQLVPMTRHIDGNEDGTGTWMVSPDWHNHHHIISRSHRKPVSRASQLRDDDAHISKRILPDLNQDRPADGDEAARGEPMFGVSHSLTGVCEGLGVSRRGVEGV